MQETTTPSAEFEDQYNKLRLKCLMDLVELAKLDKDWNPEEEISIE